MVVIGGVMKSMDVIGWIVVTALLDWPVALFKEHFIVKIIYFQTKSRAEND